MSHMGEEEWRDYCQGHKLEHWEQHLSLRSPQHTPLKSLLGKASMKTKSKPLNAKKIPVEKDGLAAKDNGALLKKIQKNPLIW